MKLNKNKIFAVLLCVLLLSATAIGIAGMSAYATKTPAKVIEDMWSGTNGVKSQAESVVLNVVFPAIGWVLVVVFLIRGVFMWFQYKREGSTNWTALIILFVSIIICFAAPAAITALVP